MGNVPKIRSVISYSKKSKEMERQWGLHISPDAVCLVHTKLRLDVESPSSELDLILEDLDGMHSLSFERIRATKGKPDFPIESPEKIVTDYLSRLFSYLQETVNSFKKNVTKKTIVDIVVTMPPVNWHLPLAISFY